MPDDDHPPSLRFLTPEQYAGARAGQASTFADEQAPPASSGADIPPAALGRASVAIAHAMADGAHPISSFSLARVSLAAALPAIEQHHRSVVAAQILAGDPRIPRAARITGGRPRSLPASSRPTMGEAQPSARDGRGEPMFHVSSVRNRESIAEHGLDWSRMGASRGIAGSDRPELAGVFLCRDSTEVEFFLRLNNTLGPVDVWRVDGVDRADLQLSGSGFAYVDHPIVAHDLRLVRESVAQPAPWPTTSEEPSGAYTSTLTVTYDGGGVPAEEGPPG